MMVRDAKVETVAGDPKGETWIEFVARSYCPTAKVFKWRGSAIGPLSFCVELATD
jgi:hypothetical protein